jgi:signal transduction histidine kinase
MIKINAKTLLSLIEDVVDQSRSGAGNAEVIREEVDIQELLDECAAGVLELLEGKNVSLGITVTEPARCIYTDARRLRRIIRELLSNAGRFIDTGKILVEADTNGEELVVTVEDTGFGIPGEELPFIFEKFRQIDGSSRRTGLALVRELVQELGGDASVTSEIGFGSRFTITIPSQRSKRDTIPATPGTVSEAAVREASNGG